MFPSKKVNTLLFYFLSDSSIHPFNYLFMFLHVYMLMYLFIHLCVHICSCMGYIHLWGIFIYVFICVYTHVWKIFIYLFMCSHMLMYEVNCMHLGIYPPLPEQHLMTVSLVPVNSNLELVL